MRKQLVLIFSAILVVTILTVGFSSKAASTPMFEIVSEEKSAPFAAQSITAVKENASFNESLPPLPDGETVAVEVKEGNSTSFRGLSISVGQVKEKSSCASDCLEVEMQLSTGAGTSTTTYHEEGSVFMHEGYQIKVSQIAPEVTRYGAPRRVVLLLSLAQ